MSDQENATEPPSSPPMTLRQQLIEILAKAHMDGARYSQEYIKAANKIARDGKPPISFYEPVTRILNNSADTIEALCQEIAREARLDELNMMANHSWSAHRTYLFDRIAELTQKPPQPQRADSHTDIGDTVSGNEAVNSEEAQ